MSDRSTIRKVNNADIGGKTRGPRAGLRGGRYRQYTPAERLASRTVKTETCWLVQGFPSRVNGYVLIATKTGEPRVYAHRLAYELAVGPIPAGAVVMHACDTPACVNPAHLSLGTQSDNIRDSIRKGRFTRRRLSDDDVEMIRAMARGGAKHLELARTYDVARSTITNIVTGLTRTQRIDLPALEPAVSVLVPVRGEVR